MTKTKRKIQNKNSQRRISVTFIFSVALILLVAISVALVLEWTLMGTGLFSKETLENSSFFIVFAFVCASIVTGFVLTVIISKLLLKPFKKILNGMSKLSEGEFSTRLSFGEKSAHKPFETHFNTLAEELQKTEILRSDFINDFSHEFKTPIVSIRGLVDLLKDEKLPKEKRIEYLAVIDEETKRLTSLTTNVLFLAKVENQAILTEKTEFNLSEQVRTAVLLLEKEWTEKNLELNLEFDEFFITANEDLLKQVWINLIDNAVKFSYKNSELKIEILSDGDYLTVSVQNTGDTISEGELDMIFNKFYQVDKKHHKPGSGIGLSIVKQIVNLHNGKVFVSSNLGVTTFTVKLPIS